MDDSYKYEAHKFTKSVAGREYCSVCGLMRLNNRFTEWAIKFGCNNSLHPDYKRIRTQYTKKGQ